MKKAILLVALVLGAAGLVQCSSDQDSTLVGDASVAPDSGIGGRNGAVGVGGNRSGAGGSLADASQPPLDSGQPADGPQQETGPVGAGGASSADGAAVGVGGSGSPGAGGASRRDAGADADADVEPACPAQAPTDNTACSNPSNDDCSYSSVTCRCRHRDSMWWCVDSAQAADAGCGAVQPTENAACKQSGLTCQVGGLSCHCNSGTGSTVDCWTCSPADAGPDATSDVVTTPDATTNVVVDAAPDSVSADAATDATAD